MVCYINITKSYYFIIFSSFSAKKIHKYNYVDKCFRHVARKEVLGTRHFTFDEGKSIVQCAVQIQNIKSLAPKVSFDS
jgi:hypothetical protein